MNNEYDGQLLADPGTPDSTVSTKGRKGLKCGASFANTSRLDGVLWVRYGPVFEWIHSAVYIRYEILLHSGLTSVPHLAPHRNRLYLVLELLVLHPSPPTLAHEVSV